MKWAISTAIDSIIANSVLSRMHISMGKSIIIIEKERLIRERSSQEKARTCLRFHQNAFSTAYYPFCIRLWTKTCIALICISNIAYIANKLGFSYLSAILDAILDFSARHHVCQFMPAVSFTSNYTEHFDI